MRLKGRGNHLVPRLGVRHHAAKLRDADITAIRSDVRASRIVASQFGISHAMVCYIRRRANWKHVL
jgi:hypothetical protein